MPTLEDGHTTETCSCSIIFEVMLPSACSFIVDGLTFSCRCSTTVTTKRNTIKLHTDGNITSKLIEQYSAAGC
jgi:hypothetical protein